MMELRIGDNIRRLRRDRNISQEKLAEVLGVSPPAVSKWERGETLPDIAMVLPIAAFFDVTTDELFGYDQLSIQADLKRRIKMSDDLLRQNKWLEANEVILETYQAYPNDFLTMVQYMYVRIGGRAEHSPEVVLEYADECISLCNRILAECTDDALRRDAGHILAVVYLARGEPEKARACFDNYPSWYDAQGQRLEQIYDRGTDEWCLQIHPNLFELLCFAMTKLGRVIWHTNDSLEHKLETTKQVANGLEMITTKTGYGAGYVFLKDLYSEAGGWFLRNPDSDLGVALDCYAQSLAWAKKRDEFVFSDKTIGEPRLRIKQVLWGEEPWSSVKGLLGWMDNTPAKAMVTMREMQKYREITAPYRRR